MDVKIVNAEALVVGPDEVLIIKLGKLSTPDDLGAFADEVRTVLGNDRFLIISAEDMELAKVKRDATTAIAPDYADSAE